MTTIMSLMPCRLAVSRTCCNAASKPGWSCSTDGRLQEHPAVEVSEHHLGASLGAIDADEREMFGTDRLDPGMNDATGLVSRCDRDLRELP